MGSEKTMEAFRPACGSMGYSSAVLITTLLSTTLCSSERFRQELQAGAQIRRCKYWVKAREAMEKILQGFSRYSR